MAHIEIKDYYRESRRFLDRAVIAGVIVVLLLSALVGRLIYLQIYNYEHFTTLSRDNRVKLLPLPPTRGLIYDRNNILLAENRPSYSLEVIPEQVKELESTIAELGKIIELKESDLERFHKLKKQKRRFDSIPIKVDISLDEAARFAVSRYRFPGVAIKARLVRHYPLAALSAHALGYVGRISEKDLEAISASDYAGTSHIGKIGVEKTYESALHGEVGLQRVEVNVLGRVARVLEQSPPKPGSSLRLHLDVALQQTAIDAFGEDNGALVAIDIKNGGILALVSNPGFDPNLFVEGISTADYKALQLDDNKPLYNRALRGQYPPGSTLKPFVGLAGLETGITTPNNSTYCPGFYRLPNHTHKYRDWKKTGHGPMAMDAAITQSCDVYFYDLAHSMGIDRLQEYLTKFNFGRQTGVDMVGEQPGILPSREWKRSRYNQAWYPGETLIMGIGQGYFLATPLQLAAATAAIANGGTYYTPRVVAEVLDNNSNETEKIFTTQRQIEKGSQQNWQTIKQSMLHVVEGERGTAKRIRSDDYRIAGKTGTAQVFTVKQDEEYDEEKISKKMRDHALFIAYAPAEDPQIAIAVVVENGGHGGSVAAPIARKIFDRYLLGDES